MTMRKLGFVTQLFFFSFFVAMAMQGPVLAEGSRSLYPATYPAEGSRANLDIRPSQRYVGKIVRETFLYVYARAGEYILVGSSNRDAGGDVLVYNPQDFGTPGDEDIPASADFTCSSNAPPSGSFGGAGRGIIASRAQELAGPNSADGAGTVTDGFAPCAYRAPADGIYGVRFTRATSGDTAPNGDVNSTPPNTVSVAAWDVTVRANAGSTTDSNGRLFTYAWAGSSGNNTGRAIYSTHYFVTLDGYRYSEFMRGLDPVGFVLYGNLYGFLDNGQPLLKDIRGQEDLVTTIPEGVTTQTPQFPIFFSDVSATGPNNAEVETVLGALDIPASTKDPLVTNVAFTGGQGGAVTTPGVGGSFQFDALNTQSYEIVISRDGVDFDPDNSSNRVISGIAGTGTQTAEWDGKDNAGNSFPPSASSYSYRVFGRNGDIHMPIIDPENNPGAGPQVTRLNGAASPSTTVYYDDRGYRTQSGALVGVLNGTLCDSDTPSGPTVPVSLTGVDSTTSYRNWEGGSNLRGDCLPGAGWGDAKGVNLWVHYASPAAESTLVIRTIAVDVGTSITGPSSAASSTAVSGTFSFFNNGSNRAENVTYGMSLPAGLGTVTFGNLPSGASASYNNATGVVTLSGFPATLEPGQTVPFMSYSFIAPLTGPVVVTTNVDTSSTDTFLDNNSATFSIGVGPTDPYVKISAPAAVTAGSTVEGVLTFGNTGGEAATGITYAASFGNAAYFPPSVSFTGLPDGASASYDPATGAVTFTGLPGTLAAGQIINIGFSYTAPGDGAVPIAASITTTSSDANPGNNSASATVLVSDDAGKATQSPLILTAGPTVACCGRPVVLKVKGGSVKGGVRYKVKASGAASCKLVKSGSKTYVKVFGPRGGGSCTVTATRKGNGTYNPVTSNSVVIRLR